MHDANLKLKRRFIQVYVRCMRSNHLISWVVADFCAMMRHTMGELWTLHRHQDPTSCDHDKEGKDRDYEEDVQAPYAGSWTCL